MDVKATLKKLHERLPNLSTDELITILACYVEHEFYRYKIGGIEYSSSDKCANSL